MGCQENAKVGEKDAETHFAQYSYSLSEGENTFDLMFFSNVSLEEKWTMDNISGVVLSVGDDGYQADLLSVNVSNEQIYDEYYMGTVSLSAELPAKSGQLSLECTFRNEGITEQYSLGIASVQEVDIDDEIILNAVSGGVVKSDDSGAVNNYGLILHIDVADSINILKLDLGLEEVGLDLADAIIYSEEEYHSGIYDAICDCTFDSYVEDCYKEKLAATISDTSLEVKTGEYYIYVPITRMSEETPQLVTGTIKINYKLDENVLSYTAVTSPYFSEYTKSEEYLKQMFGE